MPHNNTIARPYARAVFRQARTDGRLSDWSQLLQHLALIFKDARVSSLYGNPHLLNQDWITWITDVLTVAVANAMLHLSEQLQHLLWILLEKKRLLLIEAINALYHQFVADYQCLISVKLVSGFALDQKQRSRLQQCLKEYFASDVELTDSEDHALLGGVLVRRGDGVLDTSIRGRLAQLASCLGRER